MSTATATSTARPITIGGYVAPGPVTGAVAVQPMPVDMRWSGTHRITGSTKNTPDLPVGRRVRLHDQRTGDPVREMWSDPVTGAYSFDWILASTYYVTAFDNTGTYGGVIETDVQSEPMP